MAKMDKVKPMGNTTPISKKSSGKGFRMLCEPSTKDGFKFAGRYKERLARVDSNIIKLFTQEKILLPAHTKIIDNPYYDLLYYDELRDAVCFTRKPKWVTNSISKNEYRNKAVTQNDIVELMCLLQEPPYSVEFSKQRLWDLFEIIGARSIINPVKRYLDRLKWDFVERLETWAIDYCDSKDNIYTRAISKKTLISAVARAYKAGCKVDHVLVLEGRQGCGKSTLVQILGKQWYKEAKCPIGHIDAEQNLQGAWIVEFPEMWGITNESKVAQIKEYITTARPYFRKSYGYKPVESPRRCIFIGTINPNSDKQYLNDQTGGRRFWGLSIRKTDIDMIDLKGFKKVVNQLWAEAVYRYKEGEKYHLNENETILAREEQAKRLKKEAWEEEVYDYLYLHRYGRQINIIETHKIVNKLFNVSHKEKSKYGRILCRILNDLGWERRTIRVYKKYINRYVRPDSSYDDEAYEQSLECLRFPL